MVSISISRISTKEPPLVYGYKYKNGVIHCRQGPKPGPNIYSCTSSGGKFTPCSLDPKCLPDKPGRYTIEEECQTGPGNNPLCRITYNCEEGTCT